MLTKHFIPSNHSNQISKEAKNLLTFDKYKKLCRNHIVKHSKVVDGKFMSDDISIWRREESKIYFQNTTRLKVSCDFLASIINTFYLITLKAYKKLSESCQESETFRESHHPHLFRTAFSERKSLQSLEFHGAWIFSLSFIKSKTVECCFFMNLMCKELH